MNPLADRWELVLEGKKRGIVDVVGDFEGKGGMLLIVLEQSHLK